MTDQKLRLMTAASISTPARKVSRIAPKPASQLIQSLSCRWIRLPATAPITISVNATEIVSQTDSSEAASARAIHKAATNQTFSTAISCHASLDTNDLRTRGGRAGHAINRL